MVGALVRKSSGKGASRRVTIPFGHQRTGRWSHVNESSCLGMQLKGVVISIQG